MLRKVKFAGEVPDFETLECKLSLVKRCTLTELSSQGCDRVIVDLGKWLRLLDLCLFRRTLVKGLLKKLVNSGFTN